MAEQTAERNTNGHVQLLTALLVYRIRASRKDGNTLLYPLTSITILFVAATLQIVSLLSGLGLIFTYSPALLVLGFLSILVFGANMFLALLYSIWE